MHGPMHDRDLEVWLPISLPYQRWDDSQPLNALLPVGKEQDHWTREPWQEVCSVAQ